MISSVTNLADVELQLVLQWLNNDERLRTACTCKELYHACNAPFAWTHATEVRVNNVTECRRLRRSLLRWAPTSFIIIIIIKRGAGGDDDDDTLEALAGITRLTNLDTTACLSAASERMLAVLASMGVTGCRALRTLHLPGINDSSVLETLARNAPRLTSIAIDRRVLDNWDDMTMSKLSTLASFHCLEQLALRGNTGYYSSMLMGLPPLARLRVLRIDGFYIPSDSIRGWARDSAVSLGGLTHLSLSRLETRSVDVSPFTLEDLSELLAATPRLEQLDIDLGRLIMATFAKVLRELTPMLRRLTFLGSHVQLTHKILSLLEQLPQLDQLIVVGPVATDLECARKSMFIRLDHPRLLQLFLPREK